MTSTNPQSLDNSVERLKNWFETEKAKGLVDMKFHMSRSTESLARDYASDVLSMLEERQLGNSKDITDKIL